MAYIYFLFNPKTMSRKPEIMDICKSPDEWYLLSRLEVQCLNAISIHEREEDCESNQNSSNWPHEIWVISIIVFYVPLNRRVRYYSRYSNSILQVTILWYDQSVNCPCYWADPVIPNPPLGDSLKLISNEVVLTCRA